MESASSVHVKQQPVFKYEKGWKQVQTRLLKYTGSLIGFQWKLSATGIQVKRGVCSSATTGVQVHE